MELDFNLQLKQEQKLLMTPELQMSIKILQLNAFELKEFIDDQLLENPLLDINEDNYENTNKPDDQFEDKLIKAIKDNYLESENYSGSEFKYAEDSDDENYEFLNYAVKEITLWEFLKEQLSFVPLTKEDKAIGEYIIDNIDKNGYLLEKDENIADKFRTSEKKIDEMISLIQTFEPDGICARNINECLLIQLKNKNLYNKTIENIILNYIEKVAEGNINYIAKANNISQEEAQKYLNIIKGLDPKPGIRLCSDDTKYIIPDAFIEKHENKYVVVINDEATPEIKINKAYKKLLSDDKDSKEYLYVKQRMHSAYWLIKSIYQRTETIKSVLEAILEYQNSFFYNDTALKPMTLKNIADITNLHESTVSRSIKGKYVQTTKGLFEVKNFFVKGFQSESGEAINTDRIKDNIRDIINSEDKHKPLSDQQISEIMNKNGINISRRTIAKYRDEMLIPSSSNRKIK